MARRLTILALFLVFLPLAVSQQPPTPPPAAPASTDAAVVEEVNAFYADYWKAWDERNVEGIADGLDPGFLGFLYVAPQGVLESNKQNAVAGVRQFFDSVRGRQTAWSHSLLSIIPRNAKEAIVAVRNDFSLVEDGGETEITVEVVRRDGDGHWRLLRKWSEKRPY